MLSLYYSCLSVWFGIVVPAAANSVSLPAANGTCGVSLITGEIIDHRRLDPFAPTRQHRRLMISVFYPSLSMSQCHEQLVPYMPPATCMVEDETFAQYGLPNQTFSRLQLSLCEAPSHALKPAAAPLVLFSPGLGNSRLIYSVLAQSIASAGYIVVTVDHPYDANVVEFPDGSLVLGTNISTPQQIDTALQIRAKDIVSVMTALSKSSRLSETFKLPQSRLPTFNLSRVMVVGHSLGGATALLAAANNNHVIGGANLDGSFFGQTLQEQVAQPFLLFGHEGKNQSTDSSWRLVWSHLHGSKLELMLHDSQHATFSDLPVLAEVLSFSQIGGALGKELAGLLGTISGTRANLVQSRILVSFLDFIFMGETQANLSKAVQNFHEVQLVAEAFPASHH